MRTRTQMRTRIHTCARAHAYTHTHTRSRIHTRTRALRFEDTDFDGWATPSSQGDVPFTLATGGTGSIGTGPSQAAVGTGYIHAETSFPNYPNKVFDLEKSFPAGAELYGIGFKYHMYGATVGSVVLEHSADGSYWHSMWSKSSDLGDQWLDATVYAQRSGQTMLRFT